MMTMWGLEIELPRHHWVYIISYYIYLCFLFPLEKAIPEYPCPFSVPRVHERAEVRGQVVSLTWARFVHPRARQMLVIPPKTAQQQYNSTGPL